ncbi:choice-of-anchor J domain-containing protein [Flavobacterium amniphilum]|uniref:T9SS-dependent choice-of-anchor J family protein n=1 Tax=Flavobacterium amniphilum TaxID=1834035 RepID=UPI00202A84C7|nr:T9SS type A sorting domain-containing protein [Flavobacterium amniphilum]MCL9807154.1 choice-of-anchor J domain-containing protein [Flavobacterium amniphilum]
MKRNTTNLLSLLAFSFLSMNAIGQEKHLQELTPSGHIRCYTTENEEHLRAKHPERATTEEFEKWLAPQIAKIKADRAAGKNIQAVYNIPVIIHIVHDGDCIGTGENITDAQAISQITVMNQDYRRMASTPGGANTTGLAVDCEINFVLAKRDPNGNPTTGVVRHQIAPYNNDVADGVGGPDWETNGDVELMKTNTIWDPTKYLNMWTIRPGGLPLDQGGLSGLLGYAQFPDATGLAGLSASGGAANTDGVVAGFDAMGTNALNDGTFILNPTYNLGRTMTHEVGHWLGLRHIWGDNTACPGTNSNADKDYCADTPAANTANYTCNLSANTCASTPGNDMVQNYMDYTNDACMDTFTADQKSRMQTIMAGAARRNTLNASNGATAPSAGIYFNKGVNYCSVTEGTNCSYTDVNYAVSVIKAPTANAVVTFNVNGGTTATNNADFQIMTPTVTFNSGSTTSQTLTIRYYNDGIAESAENVVIGMTVNAGGGDAAIIAGDDTALLSVSIVDNDVAPTVTQSATILSSDFSTAGGWTVLDGDGDGKNWGTLTPTSLNGFGTAPNTISGSCRYSEKSLTYLGGTGSATPNNFLISPQITIPAGASAATLTYIIGGYHSAATGSAGEYAVYFTTNPSSIANITSGTVVKNLSTVVNRSTELQTQSLSALAGQTGYIVFRHNNRNASTGLLILDSVLVTATVNTEVQAVVNTGTQYTAAIPSTGTVYAKDATSGRLIADITSNTNFNYGCTTVAVTRDQATAGAAAVNFGSNTANNLKVTAKSVTVTPATNNASGAATLKFYFTEAEIAAWEAATGNNRSALRVIKQGGTTTLATTVGTFGANTTLTANVANGIGGVYYFGVQNTLSKDDFQFENFSLYPNPNKGNFTVRFNPYTSDNVVINVYDMRGRQIFEKSYVNNGAFNQEVNLEKAQSGVYLITIANGGKKTTERIIVE